jgi:hypothetical protein
MAASTTLSPAKSKITAIDFTEGSVANKDLEGIIN